MGTRWYGAAVAEPISVPGARGNVSHSNVPHVSAANIVSSYQRSGITEGLRRRKNHEENSESVWSSSNFFLARHIFIFNAAVSNYMKRA